MCLRLRARHRLALLGWCAGVEQRDGFDDLIGSLPKHRQTLIEKPVQKGARFSAAYCTDIQKIADILGRTTQLPECQSDLDIDLLVCRVEPHTVVASLSLGNALSSRLCSTLRLTPCQRATSPICALVAGLTLPWIILTSARNRACARSSSKRVAKSPVNARSVTKATFARGLET